MKTAHKLFALVFGLLLTLGVGSIYAAQVTNFNILLSETRPTTSSNYRFQWTSSTTATLEEFEFYFCDAASGTCTPPGGLITTTALKGTVTGATEAEWSLNAASAAVPKLRHVGSGESIATGTEMSVQMTSITNSAIDACDSEVSSDTCFVRMYSFDDATKAISEAVDSGVASYTVVTAITVSARVDPLFTFVISAVAADQVHGDITTSEASSYSTLPFSNLTASEPKYVAHQLNVTTNTESGYTIDQKLVTQMAGVYAGNNIDPFIASWGTPTTWTEPTGNSPNTDTGWIGANTTDTTVAGWNSAAEKFGPVANASNTVMEGTGSDDGTSAIYVTFGIEANVFQPADTYTGTLIYIALPRY